MSKVKIALAQFESSLSVEENRSTLVELAREAADGGAKLVTFHEIATTPYFCYDDEETAHFDLAEPVPGPTTEALQAVADERGISIALPIYELDDGHRYNTMVYMEPERGVVGKYRKTHVPVTDADSGQKGADEGFYFEAGETGFNVWESPEGVRVGTLICFDRHFPEGGRAYGLRGAHLLLVPTASYRGFIIEDLWEAELQTMAFQNGYYVAGVNKIGDVIGDGVPEGAKYPGRSLVVSPEGKIITKMGDEQGIVYADIDVDESERTRSGALKFLERRRPEMYDSVTETRS